jgi:hypothetical protein
MALKQVPPDSDTLAIDALTFLAEDVERLTRFLGLTGIDPAAIREAAREPHFLGSVLDYILGDEALLLAFAANHRLNPDMIARARRHLAGREADFG